MSVLGARTTRSVEASGLKAICPDVFVQEMKGKAGRQ